MSHVLRSIRAVLEAHEGKQGRALASVFGKNLKATVRDGLAVWQEHRAGTLDEANFKARAGEVLTRLDQLRDRVLTTKGNQRLLDELGRHHDKGDLARFLTDPAVSPTNDEAERALRPAVIAPKVSQC